MMMETIFILTVSLLPCLIYLSVGIYVVFKMRAKWDGREKTTFRIQKDFAILLFVIAVCYLSGCLYMLRDGGAALSEVTDRLVMKLYLVSSFMPCVYVRRCVEMDCSWFQFYLPAIFIAAHIMVTDVMLLAGCSEAVSYGILFRGSVVISLFIFCFIIYAYHVSTSVLVGKGRTGYARGLLMQILSLSVYNFFLLFYSFRLHVVLDYFILTGGFTVVHCAMMHLFMKHDGGDAVPDGCCCVADETGGTGHHAPGGVVVGSFAEDTLQDIGEDTSLSLKERLLNYFENEKPYLSKDLSMQEVAMRLFTNKSYLSKTINVEMNKNFRELVNYFRVREAMRIFSASPDISMSDLRAMCGFNNNASFTSAFKLNTGCTPGEWCRDMKTKLQEERRSSDEKQ